MSKFISIIFAVLLVANFAACSAKPAKYGNSPEQQRKNAEEAQGELSTDVNRGTR